MTRLLRAALGIDGPGSPRNTTYRMSWRSVVALSLALLISMFEAVPAAAAGTWSATGSMATVRDLHTATLLASGKVLVAGGDNSSGALASAELYDPALGTWSATGSMATARDLHTATLLPSSGKVLVAGGFNGSPLASAELYDPVAGSWVTTGGMNTARDYHTATLLPS